MFIVRLNWLNELFAFLDSKVTAEELKGKRFSEIIANDIFDNALVKVDISNLDTSKVSDMSDMFLGAFVLEEVDMYGIDTSNVTKMNGMFSFCPELTKLDISTFNTSNVEYMEFMFSDCQSLTSLDVSNFNTDAVIDAEGMFTGCEALTEIDLTSFTIDKTDYLTDMCLNSGLKRIYYSAKAGDLPSRYEEMVFNGEFILVQDNPPTGDSNSLFIYGAMFALALAGGVVAVGLKRKRER